MDNNTMRAFIIEHRESGMTFQEIADELDKLGITRTRQAIHGIYKRAKQGNKEKIKVDSDIYNLAALGYNNTEIKARLEELGSTIAYQYIIDTNKEGKNVIKEINEGNIEKIRRNLDIVLVADDIKSILSYKNTEPTDKKADELLKEVYKSKIRDKTNKILQNAYQLTGDRKIVSDIIKEMNLDTTIKEIESNMI